MVQPAVGGAGAGEKPGARACTRKDHLIRMSLLLRLDGTNIDWPETTRANVDDPTDAGFGPEGAQS
jgi:hypothetical protein